MYINDNFDSRDFVSKETSKVLAYKKKLTCITGTNDWLYKTLYMSNSCSSEQPFRFEDIQFQMRR